MALLKLTMLPLAAVLASAALAQPAQAVPIHDPMPFPVPTHEVSEPSVCLVGVDSTARVLHAAGFAPPAAKNFAVFIQRDCAAGPAQG
jgi:hypothetical protein